MFFMCMPRQTRARLELLVEGLSPLVQPPFYILRCVQYGKMAVTEAWEATLQWAKGNRDGRGQPLGRQGGRDADVHSIVG